MRAVVLAIIAAILMSSTPGNGFAETGRERPIAVRSSDNLAIYLADGTLIGEAGETFWAPSWSPDGTQLAVFVSDGRTSHPAVLDNGSRRYLFPEPPEATYLYRPIWAPDGQSIALIEYSPSGFSIVVVDAKTAEIIAESDIPARFTADFPYYTAGIDTFSWSPDGRKIILSWEGVLVFDITTNEVQIASDEFALAFWSPDSDGVCILQYEREGPNPIVLGHLRRYDLNSEVAMDIATPDEIAGAGIFRASWLVVGSAHLSPDGTSVALSMGDSTTRGDAIRIYDASQDCISDLTQPRSVIPTSLVPVMDWSPSGDAIVIFEEMESGGAGFAFAAQVVELATGNRVKLLEIELEGVEVDRFGLIGTLSWAD